jgi:hypothetical protein
MAPDNLTAINRIGAAVAGDAVLSPAGIGFAQ